MLTKHVSSPSPFSKAFVICLCHTHVCTGLAFSLLTLNLLLDDFLTNVGEQRFLNSSCAMIILIPTGCESMNYNDSTKRF